MTLLSYISTQIGTELGEKEAKGLVKDASLFVERMDKLVNEIKKQHKL